MKKTLFTSLLFIISISINAQKIKVKNGSILVDKEKIGTIQEIDIEGSKKGYLQVKDNAGKIIFNVKAVTYKSNIFETLKTHKYYTIECVTEDKTIAIENAWFYLKDKKVAKILVKNGLLNKDGINSEKLKTFISKSYAAPKYILKEMLMEDTLIKNKNVKVERDLSKPFEIKRLSGHLNGKSIYKNKVFEKYIIAQGKKMQGGKKVDIVIGYVVVELTSNGSKNIIITNSKNTPLLIANSFGYHLLLPFEKVSLNPKERMKLKTFQKSVDFYINVLLEKEKL